MVKSVVSRSWQGLTVAQVRCVYSLLNLGMGGVSCWWSEMNLDFKSIMCLLLSAFRMTMSKEIPVIHLETCSKSFVSLYDVTNLANCTPALSLVSRISHLLSMMMRWAEQSSLFEQIWRHSSKESSCTRTHKSSRKQCTRRLDSLVDWLSCPRLTTGQIQISVPGISRRPHHPGMEPTQLSKSQHREISDLDKLKPHLAVHDYRQHHKWPIPFRVLLLHNMSEIGRVDQLYVN